MSQSSALETAATTPGGVEGLPSYTELAEQEGPRFGRWAGWVEKRALERRAEREAHPQSTSWDLPGVPGANRLDSSRSTRHRQSAAAEADLAPQSRPRLANVDTSFQQQHSEQQTVARPGLVLGNQVTRLTASVSIHNIGQRFSAQLPEDDQPLCAAAIRSQVGSTAADRYLLIGSSSGLWVCDLMPNYERSVKVGSLEDAVIVQVWRGPVHRLEVYEGDPLVGRTGTVVAMTPPLEDAHQGSPATSPAGSSTSASRGHEHRHQAGDEVRLWPLQALLNLVKYRTLQPHTSPVSLNLAVSPISESSFKDNSKRGSFLGFKRTLSPGDHDPKGKGKARAQSPSIQGSFDSDAVLITPCTSQSSLPSLDNGRPAPLSRQSSSASHVDMAESWVKSSVPLALPKNHMPVQFIRLLIPPRTDPGRFPAEDNTFLAVACKSSVYLFESKAGVKRSWSMVHELYTPQQATAIDMVHFNISDAPLDIYSGARSSNSPRPPPTSSSSLNQHPALSLFVRMKEKAVLIRLADATVREVRAPAIKKESSGNQGARRRRSSFGRSSMSGRRPSLSGEGIREAIQATLKLGRTDDWWTSCTRLEVGLRQPFLLITKADRTYMVPEPITAAAVNDRGALELPCVFSWSWRLTPTSLHVWAQRVQGSSTSSAPRVKITLRAITATGVEVHEGEGNLSLLPSGGHLIWTPADQQDFDAHTSYDLGVSTQALCSIRLPSFEDEQEPERQGTVIAVQSVGEWKLKFIG